MSYFVLRNNNLIIPHTWLTGKLEFAPSAFYLNADIIIVFVVTILVVFMNVC